MCGRLIEGAWPLNRGPFNRGSTVVGVQSLLFL